jgi:hypothetical protein
MNSVVMGYISNRTIVFNDASNIGYRDESKLVQKQNGLAAVVISGED